MNTNMDSKHKGEYKLFGDDSGSFQVVLNSGQF